MHGKPKPRATIRIKKESQQVPDTVSIHNLSVFYKTITRSNNPHFLKFMLLAKKKYEIVREKFCQDGGSVLALTSSPATRLRVSPEQVQCDLCI